MQQTTLSVALEVKPESIGILSSLIDALHDRAAPSDAPGEFASFMAHVRSVHFLSMSVFPAADYDPLFVIEANFDGPADIFWGEMETAVGEELRGMIRCCKRPLDPTGPLYDAVTKPGARAPVAGYCRARALRPSVFHHGNRGLTRDRIIEEGALFRATRKVLADPDGPARAGTPVEIHRALRAALLPDFAWLGQPAPTRRSAMERAIDWGRLLLFAAAVVVVLSLPGLALAAAMPTGRFLLLLLAGCLAVTIPLIRLREPLPGTSTGGRRGLFGTVIRYPFLIAAALGIGFVLAAPTTMLLTLLLTGLEPAQAWRAAVRATIYGVLSAVFFSLPALLAWLRWLERRDSSHDAPPVDEDVERQMAQREDWIPQNHMGSVVLVRPGVLRTVIIRAGHLGLGLVLRAKAADGYLGSMRTVHFAHWAFVNNGGRLMFFSNFDQSWESYLDDFIEKAHVGLTLAWGCGVGFPPTRFLIEDGASHGRRFKAWARHSMAVSRFWYSAYPAFTVDQIERQNRVADGLRKMTLGEEEAALWISDL